ncbi:MAG TPA: transposase [Vicinamibacterales bacterium]|nr:transposase [Vicinamibacterales bacterium]
MSVHVIKRGHNRQNVFRDDGDRLMFLRILRDAAIEYGTAVHGFVLMDTHYHARGTPGHAEALPNTMKAVGEKYSSYFNRKYRRIGTPWSGRPRVIPIESAQYWLTCLRYIEQNPVRAGMVKAPQDYRWSSYRAHALVEEMPWLAPHAILNDLGSTPEERCAVYRALCEKTLGDDELIDLRHQPQRLRSKGEPSGLLAAAV